MEQQQVSSNMAGIQLSKKQVQDQLGQENEQVPHKSASNLEPVAQPQSAYVLFIKYLRKKQKDGQAEQLDAGTNFLADASKQWAALDPSAKQQF